jgi:hypothetical protein
MAAANIDPKNYQNFTMPLPFETLSESVSTFFSNLSIDVIKLFIRSAHKFSCEDSLMPTLCCASVLV